MTVFVDTSGLYALLDADDRWHDRAHDAWTVAVGRYPLLTSQLVVAETTALVQKRLGFEAADELHRVLLGDVSVVALSSDQFARAVERWRTVGPRRLSLVDVTSFVVMDDTSTTKAFVIDRDFTAHGFETLIGDEGAP